MPTKKTVSRKAKAKTTPKVKQAVRKKETAQRAKPIAQVKGKPRGGKR